MFDGFSLTMCQIEFDLTKTTEQLAKVMTEKVILYKIFVSCILRFVQWRFTSSENPKIISKYLYCT